MRKQLVKTIETSNHKVALAFFKKYNDETNNYFATLKKKGGDKKVKEITYIVSIYKLIPVKPAK